MTIEAQLAAAQIVDDPVYMAASRERMISGPAGAMEPLLWLYAHGKPVERVETGGPGAFTGVSNEELRSQLQGALGRPQCDRWWVPGAFYI